MSENARVTTITTTKSDNSSGKGWLTLIYIFLALFVVAYVIWLIVTYKDKTGIFTPYKPTLLPNAVFINGEVMPTNSTTK